MPNILNFSILESGIPLSYPMAMAPVLVRSHNVLNNEGPEKLLKKDLPTFFFMEIKIKKDYLNFYY